LYILKGEAHDLLISSITSNTLCVLWFIMKSFFSVVWLNLFHYSYKEFNLAWSPLQCNILIKNILTLLSQTAYHFIQFQQ